MQEISFSKLNNIDEIILKHEKIIFKVAARLTGRFITKSDDEYSIGLLALTEAIQSYNSSLGIEFESFAVKIIRRRLIDYYRQNKINHQNYPLDQNLSYNHDLFSEVETRLEIEEYKKLLNTFNISFAELIKVSPKHQDSRQNLISIAKKIALDEEIVQQLINTGKLPLQVISHRYQIKSKTLEKHRKYLVAIILIYWGKFTSLKDFLGWGGEE